MCLLLSEKFVFDGDYYTCPAKIDCDLSDKQLRYRSMGERPLFDDSAVERHSFDKRSLSYQIIFPRSLTKPKIFQ